VAPLASERITAVDNVGRDNANVNLSITHEHLEHLRKASVVDWLTSLIGRAPSRKGKGYVPAFGASLVGAVDTTINDNDRASRIAHHAGQGCGRPRW